MVVAEEVEMPWWYQKYEVAMVVAEEVKMPWWYQKCAVAMVVAGCKLKKENRGHGGHFEKVHIEE